MIILTSIRYLFFWLRIKAGAGALLGFLVFTSYGIQAQQDFEEQRAHMVRIQLSGRDITDKATLQAMGKVERHMFVPEDVREWAYEDRPLPIGKGQTISQPYMVAFMTQALNLNDGDKVLEIGTGSGYQAAVLAEITDAVYTIEIVKSLGIAAEKRLQAMGYSNVQVRVGDGYNGWPEAAPFDAIIVTAGAESVPEPLLRQLKDGGRMVIPVGPHHGVRQLKLFVRKGDRYRERDLMAVLFVPFTREKE